MQPDPTTTQSPQPLVRPADPAAAPVPSRGRLATLRRTLRRRPRRRWMLLGLLVIAAAVAAALLVPRLLGREAPAPAAPPSVAVARGDIRVSVPTVGTVEFGSVASLAFAATGEVVEVLVAPGDRVAAGDVLARIDDRALVRAVDDAQSALELAQVNLARLSAAPAAVDLALAQLDIDESQASLDDVEAGPDATTLTAAQSAVAAAASSQARLAHDLERLTAGATDSELADARSSLSAAQATLVRSQDTLADLEAGPTDTDLRVAQDAVADAAEALDQARRARSDATANHPAALADAQAQLATAEATVVTRREALADLRAQPTPQAVADAQAELERARLIHDDTVRTGNPASAQVKERAGIEYTQAQRAYQDALQPATADDLAEATSQLAAAEAGRDAARLRLTDLEAGPDIAGLNEAVAAAERRMGTAQLRLDDLVAEPDAADVAKERQATASSALAVTAARTRLQDAQAGADAGEVRVATEALRAAEAALADAQARLADVESGADALALQQAAVALERAKLHQEQLTEPADPLDLRQQDLAVADARRGLAAAQDALADATLRAPVEGLVLDTNVTAGERASGPAVTLAAVDSLRVRSDVDETDIGQVEVGQRVTLTFQALDGAEYEGEVVRRGAQGTSQQGLVTFPVDIKLEAPDDRILAGLSADVSIIVAESTGALIVPRSAVRETPRGAVVLVEGPDGSLTPRRVTTGLSDELSIEITEGLADGERIAGSGAGGRGPTAAASQSDQNGQAAGAPPGGGPGRAGFGAFRRAFGGGPGGGGGGGGGR